MDLATHLPESWQRAAVGAYQRYGQRLPALVAVVLALLVGRTAADLAWILVPVPESARWQPPPVARTGAAGAGATDPAALAGTALFGRYQASTTGNTALAAAPDTPLNLTLIGVLADDRQENSRALIAQGAEESAYAVGDDVSPGVSLQAIFWDRVILSRNGRLETLRLERDKPSAGGDVPPPVAMADERPSGVPPLSQVRDEVLKDPSKATHYVRMQPANVGGQLRGYRVYPGRDRSVFNAAGLRPGDLVTAVNGVQLNDPAQALQLLADLGSAGQVNLVVERGGQTQNISINLSQ